MDRRYFEFYCVVSDEKCGYKWAHQRVIAIRTEHEFLEKIERHFGSELVMHSDYPHIAVIQE